MTQTSVISRNIARVSTRGYQQNVDALAGEPLRHNKLTRLNNSLEALYDILFDQFNSIRREDYARIGPQLTLLLTTIKDLYKTCKRLGNSVAMKQETKKLSEHYSALYEIDNDIRQFRLRNQPADLDFALDKAGDILNAL